MYLQHPTAQRYTNHPGDISHSARKPSTSSCKYSFRSHGLSVQRPQRWAKLSHPRSGEAKEEEEEEEELEFHTARRFSNTTLASSTQQHATSKAFHLQNHGRNLLTKNRKQLGYQEQLDTCKLGLQHDVRCSSGLVAVPGRLEPGERAPGPEIKVRFESSPQFFVQMSSLVASGIGLALRVCSGQASEETYPQTATDAQCFPKVSFSCASPAHMGTPQVTWLPPSAPDEMPQTICLGHSEHSKSPK